MTVTYDDIISARDEVRRDGETVKHVVLTEDTIDSFVEGAIPVVDKSERVEDDDDQIGRVSSFSVKEGDRNALVTDQGTEVSL